MISDNTTSQIHGTIFNIQKFCTNDGPGIRTTIFLKGCPLNCLWCHNPEGIPLSQTIQLDPLKCTLCGHCKEVCPKECHSFNFTKAIHQLSSNNCIHCGKCINACQSKALDFCGKPLTVDAVLKIVLSDQAFFTSSGGGLTLSGGEPLLQADFVLALLTKAKLHGLHTCIETSGAVKWESLKMVAPYVDLFLFDIKETDEDRHKKYVGSSNTLILNNLMALDSLGNSIVLRCPIIPTVNNRKSHFDALISLYQSLKNVIELQIMPYHNLGEGKALRHNLDPKAYEFKPPTDYEVNEWKAYINQKIGRMICK